MTLRRSLLATPILMLATPLSAQSWPSRPVRIVVPFAPGGSSDVAARFVAPRLTAKLGQQFVVENRGGGAGNIAAEAVARSTPDGHTLLQANVGLLAVNPLLFRTLPFDPERSFQPISMMNAVPNVLAAPTDRGWRSVADLIAALRARPETLRAGHSGPGSIGHLAVLLLDQMAGTRSIHVSYRGGGPMAADLTAGHIDFAFATMPTVQGAIEAGRLVAMAVATETRTPLLPRLPTMQEAGLPGFVVANWDGWVFPAGVSAPIVGRLASALAEALAEPELVAEYARRGLEPISSTPEALAARIRAERERWAPIIRAAGVTAEG